MFKLRGLDPSMQSFPFSGTVQTTLPVEGTSEVIRSQVPRLSVERLDAGNATFVAGEMVSLIELPQALVELSRFEGESASSSGVPQLTSDLRWLVDDGNPPSPSVKEIIKSVEKLMDKWLSAVYQMHSGDRAVRLALLYQYWLVSQCLRGTARCSNARVGRLLKVYGTVLFCTDLWKCVESYTVGRFMIDIGGSLMRALPGEDRVLVFGNAPGFAAMRFSDLAGVLDLTVPGLLADLNELMHESLVSLVFG